jgi:hypothetical protein
MSAHIRVVPYAAKEHSKRDTAYLADDEGDLLLRSAAKRQVKIIVEAAWHVSYVSLPHQLIHPRLALHILFMNRRVVLEVHRITLLGCRELLTKAGHHAIECAFGGLN